MKPIPTSQEIESKVTSLYKYSYMSTLIHFAVAGFLVFTLWFTIPTDLIFKWMSLLVCTLLIGVLCFTLFNRKKAVEAIDYELWESYLTASGFLNSVVFTLGYCYAVLFGDPSLYPIVTLVMVMQLACIMIPYVSSTKVMACIAAPLALPFIASLFAVSAPIGAVLGSALLVFTTLSFLMLNYTVNRTMKSKFATESKYSDALDLINKYKHKLSTSTIEDPQTQIYNRRFFDLMSSEEIRRAKRGNNSLTIAIIAIDAFDEYFNHYGQEKAVRCLRSVAKLLTNAAPRGGEHVMRFDESKFVLLAPNIKTSEAIAFTSKIMDVVRSAHIEHLNTSVEDWETVSISIGIAEFKPGDLIGVEALVDQATFALKTAIKNGGNNTQLFAMDFDSDNIDDDIDAYASPELETGLDANIDKDDDEPIKSNVFIV